AARSVWSSRSVRTASTLPSDRADFSTAPADLSRAAWVRLKLHPPPSDPGRPVAVCRRVESTRVVYDDHGGERLLMLWAHHRVILRVNIPQHPRTEQPRTSPPGVTDRFSSKPKVICAHRGG